MSKRYHEILASAAGHHFRDEASVNAWLDSQRVTDPTTRIAVKIAIEASGERLATDQDHGGGFSLATDSAVPYQTKGAPVGRELGVWLRKAGLDVTQTYTLAQVDAALGASGLGLLERMALKSELFDRKRITGAGEVTPTPRPMAARRDLEASTRRPKPKVLRDPKTGKPAVLRGYSW